jgi:hypothetical protein
MTGLKKSEREQMINISCATREDMESSLEQMIVRCVAAYKGRVLKALKDSLRDSDMESLAAAWTLPFIERVMNETERELHKSLKVEVAGANDTLNELIDGSTNH